MINIPKEFASLLPDDLSSSLENFPAIDPVAQDSCNYEWNNKTKPVESLGKLEDIVRWMAGVRGDKNIKQENWDLHVYAGSHGIAESGVSAFPSEVNQQMLDNFSSGGAAINALCNQYNIAFQAWDTGIDHPTANISKEKAMTHKEMTQAFTMGWDSVPRNSNLFAIGEMGIGNTTIATALSCIVLNKSAIEIVGSGTGISEESKRNKAQLIDQAFELHRNSTTNPWERLQAIGGREIAAITGAILRATSWRIPVILDGLIVTAAASVAFDIQPKCIPFCLASHCSEEPAHIHLLRHYHLEPLLNLNMRLGEGSGAAMAMGVIRGAVSCYNNMATFESAGVSKE